MKLSDLEDIIKRLKLMFNEVDIEFEGKETIKFKINISQVNHISDIRLTDVDFSVRLGNILRLSNINTLEQLVEMVRRNGGFKGLKILKNFGRKSEIELKEYFKKLGISDR